MNNQKRSARMRISALALAAAVTTAVAGALAVSDASNGRRAMSIEPSAQRSEIVTNSGSAPMLPPIFATEDPELSRTDRSNEHHG